MIRRTLPSQEKRSRPPMRRVRVLIEDADLASATRDLGQGNWCEVTVCSGPTTLHDICPLVVDGHCPVGPVDVVVCALHGEWAQSVHAAWREAGTVVVDARTTAPDAPERRFTRHLGSTIAALINTNDPEDG